MTISLFTKCLFEFIGTALLLLLGDGVVASSLLKHSKGFGGGWVVITFAWGFAVMCGAFVAAPYSGAHLNPALSIGLALAHTFPWAYVPAYIIAQLAGGFLGAVLVYVFYKDHYDATEDPDVKLGTFCTMPAIRNIPRNLICEVIGTFVLVFVILCLAIDGNTPEVGLGSVGLFQVTFLMLSIRPGICLPVSLILFYRSGVKGVVDGDIAGSRFWVLSWGPVWLPGVIK